MDDADGPQGGKEEDHATPETTSAYRTGGARTQMATGPRAKTFKEAALDPVLSSNAGVVKRYTQRSLKPRAWQLCGFESHHPHQFLI